MREPLGRKGTPTVHGGLEVTAWKLKLLLVTTVWMLVEGSCVAQAQDGSAAQRQDDSAVNPQGAASGPPRGGSPTPYRAPIVVPSAAGSIAPLYLPTPNIVVTQPTPPSFTGTCDSAGCWGSDGTRYNAVGGSLMRPDGRMCQSVGGVMQCP